MSRATKTRIAENGHPLLNKKFAYKERPSMRGRWIGEKNPLWKGGITAENKKQRTRFRDTLQKEILKRDDYTCQLCGARGGLLHVDHIQPWAEYVELRFSMDNCRTLCQACHYFVTFNKPIPNRKIRWGINPKGGD